MASDGIVTPTLVCNSFSHKRNQNYYLLAVFSFGGVIMIVSLDSRNIVPTRTVESREEGIEDFEKSPVYREFTGGQPNLTANNLT